MSEGQAIILVLIIMQIVFMVFAGVEQYLELKKLEKKRNIAIIKIKWLECACRYEI